MPKLVGVLAWAWLIIVGALMFTPIGPVCIACGRVLTTSDYVIGIVSIALGLGGLLTQVGGARTN
jgi:hypothetical protein